MTLGNAKKKSKITRITILALILFAGAWFLSSNTGLAASSSSNVKVKIVVREAVGVIVGKSGLGSVSGSRNSQVITEFVTGTASSRLGDHYAVRTASTLDALTQAAFRAKQSASRLSFDDVVPGGAIPYDKPATEMIVTVSML